jgi:hypothetical protein
MIGAAQLAPVDNSRSLNFAIRRRFVQCSLFPDHFQVRSASPTIVRAPGAFRAAAPGCLLKQHIRIGLVCYLSPRLLTPLHGRVN